MPRPEITRELVLPSFNETSGTERQVGEFVPQEVRTGRLYFFKISGIRRFPSNEDVTLYIRQNNHTIPFARVTVKRQRITGNEGEESTQGAYRVNQIVYPEYLEKEIAEAAQQRRGA